MEKPLIQQIVNKYKLMKADDLVKEARGGNAEAACELAKRLYAGKGVDKSYELAREWFAFGAEEGHTESRYELGQMLVAGLGGDEDETWAAELFKKASEAGHRGAMFELGVMYAMGRGVKKNYVKASKYLRLSGTEQARAMLDKSVEWWKPVAEQGLTEGEYQYAVCLINNYGGVGDVVKGLDYMYRAAIKGHAKAMDAMSQIYEVGIGVPADKAKAEYWKKEYCKVTGVKPEEVGLKRESADIETE
ncbi:MAG: sel1 repeat family protein [Clostridia bacterium]|nr:sel1 repeat family protein [Clostridia bacterium]